MKPRGTKNKIVIGMKEAESKVEPGFYRIVVLKNVMPGVNKRRGKKR